MSVQEILSNDTGSLFIQPDGPNGAVYWLGCHDVGDITKPLGDESLTFCPDRSGRNRARLAMRAQGQGGLGSFDITFPLSKTADWLEIIERKRCLVPFYIQMGECAERDVFLGFDRGRVIQDCKLTSNTDSNWSMRNSGGEAPVEATRSFTLSFFTREDYFTCVATRWAHASATALLGITEAGRDNCLGACGAPQDPCEILYTTNTSTGAAKTIVQRSADFGHTWAAVTALNFLVAEDAGPIVSFAMSATVTRVLAACSVTVAGQPAKVCYSDDLGVTWTDVLTVGSTNTEWINDMFAWSNEAIWVCTDTGAGAAGNVYFSADGGLTWTIVLTGATDSLNAITFASRYQGLTVGDTNEIQWTEDGGAHWTAITGPAAQAAVNCTCCGVLDAYRWFVGYDDGEVWFTQDGGTAWTQRVLPNPTGATAIPSVLSMKVVDDYCIWLGITATVGGNPFAAMMRTVNGGTHWESWLAPATGTGIVDLVACSYNQAFGVGGLVAATGLVLEVAEKAG